MSYKATKTGLALSILACFIVLLFITAPFYVLLVFVAMCCVFWLFLLSYQYLPTDWLERLLWGSLIVARGSSPQSPSRRVSMIFLVYCFASLYLFPSVLGHCWLGDRKGILPVKNWMLVCWWWWFDRSFARLIAPVVTTISIILCFNKHRLTQVNLKNGRWKRERESFIMYLGCLLPLRDILSYCYGTI